MGDQHDKPTIRLREAPVMKDVFKELFPPDEDGRPLPPLTRWRIAVFAVCCSMITFMCWSLSPVGFALAQDMNKVKGDVGDIQLGQLELNIYDAKESECTATDPTAIRFFSSRVMELARKYNQLSDGVQAIIPPCKSRKDQHEQARPTTNF